VQELLKLGDPFLWGIVAPLVVLALLALVPYLFPRLSESELGRWFPRSGRTAQIFVGILIIAIIILTLLVIFPNILP
jgi:quinol-cytochrome oxidoreductase complex cytochrome b subunit